MKKLYILLVAIAICMFFIEGYAQKSSPKQTVKENSKDIDTRIDNMRYWMQKAEEGIIPFNPAIPVKPAKFKGSKIPGKGLKNTNSVDIPVSNQTDLTESENSIFVDPNNADYLLNSNNSTGWDGTSYTTLYGANYFQSSNGGATWGGSYQGAGETNRGDPTTAIGLNGREYVNYISSSSGQGIAYSDNGSSWTTASVAPNPGSLADKNHMWIDNSPSSSYEGNLYCAWTDFGGSDDAEIKINRSTNDGPTWSTPVNISSAVNAGSHNQGVHIQTGPNGEVYVAWSIYDGWPTDETAIGFTKSTNGGGSYQTASRIISNIRGIRTTETSKNHRVNSFPVMAVDISGGPNNGNIYIVWTNIGTPGVNSGTPGVYMIRSTNGGTSWSTPVKVNQGNGTSYFPWITCDPVTGTLSVVFYDDRNVSSSDCEVFVANSFDAGNTWTDFIVSDVSFTPSAIPGLAGGYMGDYLGITAKGGKVYPCWTDTRGGLFMTYVSPFVLGLNAEFTADDTEICTGSSVSFTDMSSGNPSPISWQWTFTGGSPSSYNGQNPPPVTYSSPGNYTVSLTVFDGTDYETETKTNYITVKNVVADFTGFPTTVVVGNSVTFTDNSDCSPTSWSWSFPGGSPASFNGQNPPAIIYNTEGTYNVTLTVTNGSGNDTKVATDYITVAPPEFNMQNGTVTTCMGNFYDSGGPSGSYSNNEDFVMTFYPATSGAMLQFDFTTFDIEYHSTCGYDYLNIYDGENTSATQIGQYCGTSSPGFFTATNPAGAITFQFHSDYSVTDIGWVASISCFSTNNPPVADFTADDTTPDYGQTVNFTDLSTNTPTSWLWVFNPTTITYVGGTNSSSQNPQVQFDAAGQYTATLTATNAYGSDDEIKTNYINASGPQLPVADFVADNTTPTVGQTVSFTDLSTNTPTSWSWVFNPTTITYVGGTNSSSQNPQVQFDAIGQYTVSLTATNAYGNDTETKTNYISVNNCTYCATSYSNQTDDWISNVTFNTINNSSGSEPGGYADYTSETTSVALNSSYNISIDVYVNGNWVQHTWAWIDWNQNCDFSDPGEAYDLGATPGTTGTFTLSTSIVVPGTALPGITRMRVAERYSSDPEPCTQTTYGEAEDYSVDVGGGGTAPVADFTADNTTPVLGQTVNFTDQSTNAPTLWLWVFNPTTITFVGGTNSSSQNPQVQFNITGQYTVTLTATNTFGNDTEIKTNYINATPPLPSIPPYVDDFESYTSGNYLAVQSPYWTTWTNLPGSAEDGLISTDYAQSGIKSVKVDGTTDLVLELGDKTSGKYMVNFEMYIPSGYYGFFDLLQIFNGADSEWGIQVFFDTGGNGHGDANGQGAISFTYNYDTWLHIDNVIDLDNDWAEFWLDGTLIYEWQWSQGSFGGNGINQLAALNMYAWDQNGTPLYYFDDVSYFEIIQLDLNVLLEGPYNQGTSLMNTDLNVGNYIPLSQPYNVSPWNYNGSESVTSITDPTIVDWVLVELRDATTADQALMSTIIDRKAAFLKNNGQVVDIDGNTVMEFRVPFYDNLFVVAYHLNHLGVISSSGLTQTGSLYNYNFSTGVGQAHGGTNAHNEIAPGIWGMAGGDGNRDGQVGFSDKITLWEIEAGTKGYLPSDFNLDSESNNQDKDDIWLPNIGQGSQVPN